MGSGEGQGKGVGGQKKRDRETNEMLLFRGLETFGEEKTQVEEMQANAQRIENAAGRGVGRPALAAGRMRQIQRPGCLKDTR